MKVECSVVSVCAFNFVYEIADSLLTVHIFGLAVRAACVSGPSSQLRDRDPSHVCVCANGDLAIPCDTMRYRAILRDVCYIR